MAEVGWNDRLKLRQLGRFQYGGTSLRPGDLFRSLPLWVSPRGAGGFEDLAEWLLHDDGVAQCVAPLAET